MTPIFFETAINFRAWLVENHNKKTELLVGFYKTNSGKFSMSWSESVDLALCFGWIDGVRKSIDEVSYSIRFTPRKKTSIWSAINIKKVEELTKSGLMQPAGLKAFSLRTEKKSKIYAHENENINLDVHLENLFKEEKIAWDFFINQAASYKKVITHWIMSAKQEKTQKSLLDKLILASKNLKRLK